MLRLWFISCCSRHKTMMNVIEIDKLILKTYLADVSTGSSSPPQGEIESFFCILIAGAAYELRSTHKLLLIPTYFYMHICMPSLSYTQVLSEEMHLCPAILNYIKRRQENPNSSKPLCGIPKIACAHTHTHTHIAQPLLILTHLPCSSQL